MRARARLIPMALAAASTWGSAPPLQAQRIPFDQRFFSEQVLRDHDQPVIPIFEGWYANADGSRDLCFGYFNLNLEESVDVPLGDANVMEPARYDGRQPTHFMPVPGMTEASPFTSRFRRAWCTFTVTVPSEFGADDQVVWTLRRENGPVITVPGTVNAAYVLDEPESGGRGDVAPTLRLSEGDAPFQGRRGATAAERTARVGEPLELSAWVGHPFEEELWVGWIQYRGPGEVRFGEAETRVPMQDEKGIATTTATFSEPGEYEILVQTINSTASFEYHCCWTNGYIPVRVVR